MTLKAVYALAKKSKKRAINHYEAREMMKKSLHIGLFSKYLFHPETFRVRRVALKTDKTK